MDKIEITLELLGSVLGTPAGTISDAIKKEDGTIDGAKLEEVIKAKIQTKLDDAKRAGATEGLGRGKREALNAKEKEIAEKYGITEALQMDDLLDKIIESKSKTPKLDEDKIKGSEYFINAMRDEKKRYQTLEEQFNQHKTDVATREKRSGVSAVLPDLLAKHKFVLPENEAIRKNVMDAFRASLFIDGVDYQVGDEIKVTNKEGNPLLDAMHNPVTFEGFVLSKARGFFEQAKGDDRKSPGAGGGGAGGGGGKAFTFPTFANIETATAHAYTITDKEEAAAFAAHVETTFGKK